MDDKLLEKALGRLKEVEHRVADEMKAVPVAQLSKEKDPELSRPESEVEELSASGQMAPELET